MGPDGCLFCPARIGVPIAELLCRRAERRRIVQRLVAGDGRPVERLWRGVGVRMILDDGRELLFGLGEQTSTELRMGEAQLQLSEKVVSREEPFDSVLLRARVIDDQRGWRPLRVEALTQLLELIRL